MQDRKMGKIKPNCLQKQWLNHDLLIINEDHMTQSWGVM